MNKDNSDGREKKETMLKENKLKEHIGTEQKQKMKVFCLFFLCFEVKREKDLNSFKNNGKYNGCFAHTKCLFKKKKNKRTETEYKR